MDHIDLITLVEVAELSKVKLFRVNCMHFSAGMDLLTVAGMSLFQVVGMAVAVDMTVVGKG